MGKNYRFIRRAVMSETIGERHASACRYYNEVPEDAAPLAGLNSDRVDFTFLEPLTKPLFVAGFARIQSHF